MKKSTRAIAAVSALFLILSMATVGAATTATQNVVLDITESYTGVAAIRVFDGTTVNPTITFTDSYTGTWNVSDAGSEASKSSYAGHSLLDEKSGGSLQYTVAGLGDQKITVHSGTANYNTETLYVLVGDPQDDGGTAIADAAHGVVVNSGELTDNKFLIAQGSLSAKTVINAIPGTNTYTGTALGYGTDENAYVPGAPIIYGFTGTPGVSTIAVTYTITADSV